MIKKILAIDGGGIKGVFPASFLSSVEDTIGDKVSNYFDLIVGTSTGGIIALGLGMGMPSSEILSFYKELGPNIFRKKPFNAIRRFFSSKYNQAPLHSALESKFKTFKLGESSKRLVIPSLNLETGGVHLYKTAHHPRLEMDYKESVVRVALATASAPTYFPTFKTTSGIPLVDGGMWANNPIGVAVVEAIGILKWEPDSLRVLSLGCTTEVLDASTKSGARLALKIIDVFMAAQSSASLSTAQVLVGDKQNIIRISPKVGKNRFALDGIDEIESLEGLGNSEARENLPKLREIFFDMHVEPFIPCYKLVNKP